MANEFRIKNGFFSEGSSNITGSLNVSAGITGSLLGTASYATQALSSSYAVTASYYGGSIVSASYALTSSYSNTSTSASYALNATTASFATLAQTANTASYVVTAQTASYVLQAVSASYATQALSASYYGGSVTSASYALTASYVNPLIQDVQITGSLFVSQSLDTSARILYDSTGINTSIDWAIREAVDAALNASINWDNRKLYSLGGVTSLDWTNDLILNSGLYQRNEKETNKQEIISDTINDSDNSYLGDIISVDGINTFIDGTVNNGMLVYLGTDATWYPVTQNSTTATKMLGIAFKVNLGTGLILLDGHVVITDTGTGGPHVTGADHGLPIYIEDNTTTGQMSTTLPTTTGGNHVVRVLGHCYWQNLTTTSQWMMKFRPSNDWITI